MPALVGLPSPTLDAFGEAELLDLDDRSAHILRMRSGMFDGERHKLREIGDELGIRHERVRNRAGAESTRELKAAANRGFFRVPSELSGSLSVPAALAPRRFWTKPLHIFA